MAKTTKTRAEPAAPEALPIELWDIERLVPYEKNAKLHPEEQVKRLAATIARFGWDQPIVVDADGVIIKGHGRRLAALSLKIARVPVLVRRDLTKSEADAVRISDNAVVGLQFDTRAMQEELLRLMGEADLSFSADDLGLSAKDHDLLLRQIDVPDTDALMEDTGGEIERQKAEDEERVEKSDREEITLGEAFGFKRITREQGRLLNVLMARAESDTGKGGADALFGWISLMIDGGGL